MKAGDRLRDVTLLRALAEGGAADAWLAKDGEGRRVVVRVLRGARTRKEPEEEQRDKEFEAHLSRARRVNHPGVVRVLGGGVEEGVRFSVVEHVDGVDLAFVMSRAEKNGRWPSPETSAAIVARVARAVAAVHQQAPGIRLSLVPSKILIDRSGAVKLADFSCAPLTQVEIETTRIKSEQRSTDKPENGSRGDPRSDVFALGTILLELLTQKKADVTLQTPLFDIVRRALRKVPSERYSTAAELAEALENAVAGHPGARPEKIADLIPADMATSSEQIIEPIPDLPPVSPDEFFDPVRDAPNAIGKRFEILGRIGEGGMGEVYRARDRELNELVALKILNSSLSGDSEQAERMRREVRLARKISSPRVCRIFDLVELDNGTRAVAMELIQGRPLSHLIWEGMPLDYRRFASWGADIADGLAAAHAHGIVHRDLKPDNIMIAADDRAVILDFGVAYTAEWQPSDRRLTAAGVILGTLPYMAPEQLSAAPLDGRADLYSLGLIMAELITGEVPFTGTRYEEVLNRRVIKPEIFRLKEKDASVPDSLDKLVTELLAPARADRPASAAMVADMFRAISRGEDPYVLIKRPTPPILAALNPPPPPPTAILTPEHAIAEPQNLTPILIVLGVIAAGMLALVISMIMPKKPVYRTQPAIAAEDPTPLNETVVETSTTAAVPLDAGVLQVPDSKAKTKTKTVLPNAEEM